MRRLLNWLQVPALPDPHLLRDDVGWDGLLAVVAPPHGAEVGGVDGEAVAELALVADHGRDGGAVLPGIPAALAHALEAPGGLEVEAAVASAVELRRGTIGFVRG